MDRLVNHVITHTLTLAAAVAALAASMPARAEAPQAGGASAYGGSRLALVQPQPVPLPRVDQPAGAQVLTLAEAEQLASARHPSLREAEAEVQAAEGHYVQHGLLPNPEVGYSGTEIGEDGSAGKQGGFMTQEIVTAGKLRLDQSVAAQEVAAAGQRLSQARLRVTTLVRTYYFQTLGAERSEALARQLVAIGEQAVRASELRLKAMEGTRADVLQSQIERDSAELLAASAANRREAAWRRLATLVGRDPSVPEPLEDVLSRPLPALSWETARGRLLAESPQLAELQFDVERARWAADRANAGRVPNVDVLAGVQFDNASQDTIANVELSVPLPVFDRNQGAIAQACGQLAAARAALQRRRLELEERLAGAIRDYLSARQRVIKYEGSILPAARESLDMVAQAYDRGEIDYHELMASQRSYTQSNLAYLQDLETAWRRWAEIDGLLVPVTADDSP